MELRLSHERRLREREELRNLVDQAAARIDVLMFEVIQALTEIPRAAAVHEVDQIPPVDELPDDFPFGDFYRDKVDAIFTGIREVDGFGSRLKLRLGIESEAAKEFDGAAELLGEVYQRLIQAKFDPVEDAQKVNEIGLRVGGFMRVCHGPIGTDLGT